MQRRLLVSAPLIFLIASLIPLCVTVTAQQEKRAPWQTDWKAYVAELSKDLQKGIDPGEDPQIKGKVVEFEGTMAKAFDATKPDETVDIEMEPQSVTVMLKLFPMVDAEKAGDRTGTVTLKKIIVKPAEANRDAWKALTAGAKVRFRATVGNDAAVLVTTSDIGGLVFLFLNSAEVVPPK
ncbi:MAG TPA: hypothetical protein VGJ69_10300 [Pyrinomonadaceae bacterium]|jgi:hypothetical protein